MTNWADIKAAARRKVHLTFAVPCIYVAPGSSIAYQVTARLHTKELVSGANVAGDSYAQVIEGVSKVIFNKEELALLRVVPRSNGKVTFPSYGVSYVLDIREPDPAPVTETWTLGPA